MSCNTFSSYDLVDIRFIRNAFLHDAQKLLSFVKKTQLSFVKMAGHHCIDNLDFIEHII